MRIIKIYILFILSIIMILAFAIFMLPKPEGFPILEYHTITDTPDEDSEKYNVLPSEFSKQLDYLKENGYNTITTLDYINAKRGLSKLPKNPIILTFDDGYENNYLYMLPILEAHDMKAVVYVITNEIGKPGYLTIEELIDMQNRGVEIGSHTANHRPLIDIKRKHMTHEIRDSKIFLEWKLLNYVTTFSYPNGFYSDDIIKELQKENYLTAVTGDAGLNNSNTNPYLLQRVNIPQPTFGIFEFKLRLLKAEIAAKLGIFQHKLTGND